MGQQIGSALKILEISVFRQCRSYFENLLKGIGAGKLTFVCESCYVEVVHLHHPAVAGHPGLHCHPSHLLPRHQAPHTHSIHILDTFLHNFTKLGCQIRIFNYFFMSKIDQIWRI
jgi:hypothetical protein